MATGFVSGAAARDVLHAETPADASELLATKTLLELNAALSRRIEEETAKAVERERLLLRQAHDAAMGEMIGNIAHQWRQPLSSLDLILQNLRYDGRDGALSQPALEAYLDRAQRTIDQMAATIDDFRLFFMPSASEEKFGLLAAIGKCGDLVGASLAAHNIDMAVAGEEIWVCGRESEFLQVILNLISNAKDVLVERQVANGRIEIGVARAGDAASICLRDNGGGIAAVHLAQVFDPYFTTKEKGTGIGLHMARTIVEQHLHGTIHADNWDEGAQFSVVLPLLR